MTSTATPLDRRRNAFRPDLADVKFDGRVGSARFVAGVTKQVRHPVAPMRQAPDASLGLENEALFGESVTVFDEAGGWAWGQLQRDGYVGYFPAASLSDEILTPTHRVRSPATFVYPEANIKLPPRAQLSLNAVLTVTETTPDGRFVALATGGFVFARHVNPIATFARDYVDVAEHMVHTPYLWGGRTRLGLDCSALVQLSLEAAGITCPRDSDMGAAELGETVLVPADFEGLMRGDIVYWPGHCGIMIDSVMLLHANGYHMSTVIEPLSQAARRIRKAGGGSSASGPEISAIRRLPTLSAK
jgi:cell wall-associated NlpC family hydrolase